MNEPRRTFDERVKAISGTLGVVIGLLTLVPQFSKNISEAVDAVIKLPPMVWYLVPVLLLVVGGFALRDGLARRSRLLRPEALLLKADNPAHLKGREEDIDRLSALCDEYKQVNLVGESGAGKSALIQAGLCPKLRAEQRLFPIYLNVCGQDWEAGPRTALIHALWETFSNEDRQALGFTEPPKPEHLVSTLEHVKAKLGRTPLIIFDQFDDYQTRHRSQFLAGRRRTWLSTNRLITANAFWGDIKEAIDNHTVHCLFATRADTADGLESIRLTAPQVYRLDRLNADFVLPLLTERTANVEGAEPVVFAPDRGWGRLKGRLARDLSQDGAVLPVQMKIALQCLASLRSLTVGDYERAGGVDGLQAAHIDRHVANTAIHSGLTKRQVRTLLVSLADAETLKTMPRSTAELEKAIVAGYETNADRIASAVEAALDDLEMKEIIRKRLDPDNRQHVWILDHDYLCRGVLEAERRANQWFTLAQEGYRAFQDAGDSIWRAWRSLLSPWQQMMLASQRLRSRFRYETLQSYAAWSLVRFVPYFLVLAVVGLGWIEIRQRQQAELDRNKAEQIRAAIGLDESLLHAEVDQLWELANSDDAVRYSFIEQALKFPVTAEQFNRRDEMAVQAVVGLDPEKRENILKNSVYPRLLGPSPDLSIKLACVRIGIALSLWDRYPEFALLAVKTLKEAIEKATDPRQLYALGIALQAAAGALAPAEAQQAFTHLLSAMEKTTNSWQLTALADALQAAKKLAPAKVQWAFTHLLSAIEKTPDPDQLHAMVDVLMAVLGTLAPMESRSLTQAFTALEKTTYIEQLSALADALQAAKKLAPAEEQRVVTYFLTAIERTTDPEQLGALAKALKAVPGTLDIQQLITLLKWPVSVGALRSTFLDMLEKQTDQKFDGNLWKMVGWAQQNGLDVKSSPKRPDRR